jgi:hypothetical protein
VDGGVGKNFYIPSVLQGASSGSQRREKFCELDDASHARTGLAGACRRAESSAYKRDNSAKAIQGEIAVRLSFVALLARFYAGLRRFIQIDSNKLALSTRKHGKRAGFTGPNTLWPTEH